MAKAYLEPTDQTFTANNPNTTIYGQDGQQSIVISGSASNIILDQNIEEILLQKPSTDYTYKQTGNTLKLYEVNTLILSITLQGDNDGTKLIFSNGYAYATLQDSIMKLGGSTSSQTEDASIRVFDQNQVINPLTLKTTTPSNNQSSVASDTNFTLTFSESVTAGSAKYITIKKTNDNSTITTIETTDPQITINGDTVTINPTNNLPTDSGYYILIDKGAFVSSSGSMYEGISSSGAFGFSTPVTYYPDPSPAPAPAPPADTTAPTLSSSTPIGDATGVAQSANIVLTMSENVTAVTGKNITIKKTSDNSTVATIDAADAQVSVAGSVVTINQAITLGSNTGYYVLVDNGAFKDSANNVYAGISSNTALSFTTAINPNVSLTTIAAGTGGFAINGEAAFDNSGASVSSAGDVNGDGLADLIVGALGNDATASDAGRSYVVFGKSDTTMVSLATIAAGTGGFAINGEAAWDYSGVPVSSAGDVNGDGLADLIVGAYRNDTTATDAGRSYVVFGKSDGGVVSLSTIATGTGGFAINGEAANDGSGGSVSSAGDVNGDGLADLIVGARYNDTTASNAGRSYVVFGKSDGGVVSLSTIATGTGGFAINGEAADDESGTSVSSAGDINGDGLADLIVGAYLNNTTATDAGRSYVIFGGSQWLTESITGSGTVNGTAASEALIGSSSPDTLTGNGGIDRFYSGDGADTIILTPTDITNLSDNGAGFPKAAVDGGGDIDTLRLSNGANLDLTVVANQGAAGVEENSRIESIECIDLATDTAANAVTLTIKDVIDISGMNLFNSGNGYTGLAASVSKHQIIIEGGATDTLTINEGTGTFTNTTTATYGGNTYNVYENATSNAQILVLNVVGVTNNDV